LNYLRGHTENISEELLYEFSEYSLNFAYTDYKKINDDMPLQYEDWDFNY